MRLIDAAPNRLYRMILVLLYATGVRRTEAARIKVEDIDSKRMVIHIRQGKGARDRDVPLSPKLLEELRSYWQWKKPRGYLFPSTAGQRGVDQSISVRPSGTPAGSRPPHRRRDSPRRFILTCCAIASRRTYSKPVLTCAPFNCFSMGHERLEDTTVYSPSLSATSLHAAVNPLEQIALRPRDKKR